jgi:putative membrane protein
MKPLKILKVTDGAKGSGSAGNRPPQAHLSEHLANERTYLAYLRTSVSLLSFGITINRFSLYLIQSKAVPERALAHFDLLGLSKVGFGMVILGLLLMLWAGWHFTSVSRGIDRGDYQPNQLAAWIITLFVLLGGGISLIWLFPH